MVPCELILPLILIYTTTVLARLDGFTTTVATCNTSFYCPFSKNVSYKIQHRVYKDVLRSKSEVYFDTNGSIVTQDAVIPPQNYCISHFTHQDVTAVACVPKDSVQRPEKEIYNTILLCFYYLACIFLFLIVFFYGLTFHHQQINGWIILAFSVCEFSGYVFWTMGLTVWQLEPIQKNGLRNILVGTPLCIVNNALSHYFDVAGFTWMTIINYDMCYTIRSMTLRSNRSKEKLRFALYCLFGFGIPMIIVTISSVLDHVYGRFKGRNEIRKQYGNDPCGLYEYYDSWHVLSLFGVALTFKGILILVVIKTLVEYHQRKKNLGKGQRKLRSQIFLYCKLFVLMDFTWIFDTLILELNFGEFESEIWFRTIQDTIYISQNFFLFWVFVCNQEMKDMLLKHYPIFKDVIRFFLGSQDECPNSQINSSEVSSAGAIRNGNCVRANYDSFGSSISTSAGSESKASNCTLP